MTLRAEGLLARYPDLSNRELTDLIDIFPALPIVDRGLITADARLSDKLAAFYRDHGSQLKAPVAALISLLALPIIAAAGTLWWLLG